MPFAKCLSYHKLRRETEQEGGGGKRETERARKRKKNAQFLCACVLGVFSICTNFF